MFLCREAHLKVCLGQQAFVIVLMPDEASPTLACIVVVTPNAEVARVPARWTIEAIMNFA